MVNMTQKALAIVLGAAMCLTQTPASAQKGVNQTVSGIIYAGPVGHGCTSESCAKVTTVRVYLPLDANVVKIRLMSAGVGREDMHENNPGDDIQWARWAAPVQGTTPTNKYIDASFRNRSGDQRRKIQVIVDWTSGR